MARAAATAENETRTAEVDAKGRAYGTGRRKNAVARVWVKKGKGKYSINGKTLEQCAEIGTICAAEVIMHMGPRPHVSLAMLLPEDLR